MIKGKVLLTTPMTIYYSIGLDIFSHNIQKNRNKLFLSLPANRFLRFVAKFDLLARMLRLHVHHMIADNDSGFYIVFLKNMIRISIEGETVGKVVGLVGNRPLCIAEYKHKMLFGEYRSNPNRNDVGIYSYDGFELKLLCSVSNIRHFHGVFVDHYDGTVYVTTGDYGQEAGIWVLNIESGELLPLLIGGQQSRAVQLLFSKESIYFGTDTPLEQNYIYKVDKKSNEITKITKVSSSIFYGAKWGDRFVFSTVVEPSIFNKTRFVELWNVENDKANLISIYKKDFWSMKYFQYGQLVFSNTDNQDSQTNLWVYKLGVDNTGSSEKIL